MTCDQERKIILKHVSIAKRSGASWQAIDDTIGMSSRTLIRWRNDDTGDTGLMRFTQYLLTP